jgi:hypothetical protein
MLSAVLGFLDAQRGCTQLALADPARTVTSTNDGGEDIRLDPGAFALLTLAAPELAALLRDAADAASAAGLARGDREATQDATARNALLAALTLVAARLD